MKKIIFLIMITLLTGCSKFDIDQKVNPLVEKFYNENLKEKIDLPVTVTISLENLKNAGIDITKLEEHKCNLTSYSKIMVEEDDSYEIENFYECGELNGK